MTRRKNETRTTVAMPALPQEVLERVAKAHRTDKKGNTVMLSSREWAFVHEYVTRDGSMTRTEAAIRAGYSPKNATNVIRVLLDPERSPHVVAAVNELRMELAEKYGTNFERHMRDLQMIRDKAIDAGAWSAAVQAEYRRGQALGTIYVDRKEIRHGTIDSMSKEEVMRKLEELRKVYGGKPPQSIMDVEVTEVEKSRVKEIEAEPADAVLIDDTPKFDPEELLVELKPPLREEDWELNEDDD